MRGTLWIEPVTGRLPTSGHEKAHPACHPYSEFPLRMRRVKVTLKLSRSIIGRTLRETSFPQEEKKSESLGSIDTAENHDI